MTERETTPHGVMSSSNRLWLRHVVAVGVVVWVAAASVAAAGQPVTSEPEPVPQAAVTSSTTASTTSTTSASTSEAPSTASSTSTTAAPTTAPPTTAAPTTGASTTEPAGPTTVTQPSTSTTLDAEQQRERDRAVANLNLARSNDREIAAQLRSITEQANETVERIASAESRLERAQALADRSAEALEESGARQGEIEASLAVQAVEGYKTRAIGTSPMLFSEVSVNEAIRQNQLLDEANSSTADLLEDLRTLLEDRRLANAEAEQAAVEAEQAQTELEAELERLKEQQVVQIGLKAEAERRIDEWAGELTAYAQADAAVQDLIGRAAQPVEVNTGVANPTNPSALGFQWPIDAPMTSPYGYRVHPVYGTRRLHAGIDLGAPRGTPIAASNDGAVIFAGVQGGYGNTVIVDHGGGITTLYAHLSSFGSALGDTVSRGDIVGYVGATGTATGNHLHFEVRVNGGPVNPVNYLP